VSDRPVPSESFVSARATRAIIDLGRIQDNVSVFRQLIGHRVKLMAVVKANGYGHGAVMIAKTAVGAGTDYLGVATVDEGAQLRKHGLIAPILVVGPVVPGEIPTAIHHDLELAVGSMESISAVDEAAKRCPSRQPIKLHLKIDTGMRRFGCLPGECAALAKRIAEVGNLLLAGTLTHFACADEIDETPTLEQQAVFESALLALSQTGVDPGIRHAANSAATLRSRRYDYDMVRIGISLYGIAPSPDIELTEGLKPAMSIRSKIGRVIDLAPGDRVSYGGTYEATQHERAALVPIGYGDGYQRGLSNKAWMGMDGHRCPVRGRVCMDQTVVGLPLDSSVREGDDVIVAGEPETGAPTLNEMAEITGTIPYEIATGIAKRVPRVYVDGDLIVAIEDLHGLQEIS